VVLGASPLVIWKGPAQDQFFAQFFFLRAELSRGQKKLPSEKSFCFALDFFGVKTFQLLGEPGKLTLSLQWAHQSETRKKTRDRATQFSESGRTVFRENKMIVSG
jgi:hypothetical protein